MLTQKPWSISTTSCPWSSQRFLRLSMSSRSRGVEGDVVHPRLEAEAHRDGRVERRHAVVVQLPERDQLRRLALDHLAGGVEDVLGPPAGRIGGGGLRLHELEAHHVRVEAVGLGQVADRDGNVVVRHAASIAYRRRRCERAAGWSSGGCWSGASRPRWSWRPSTTEDADAAPRRPVRTTAPRREDFVDAWERARHGHVRAHRHLRAPQRRHRLGDQLRGRARPATAAAPAPPARWRGRAGRPPPARRAPARPTGRQPEECTLGRADGPVLRRGRGQRGGRPAHPGRRAPRRSTPSDGRRRPGCFDLVQLRVEPRAPFGREARFCFDEATGAPTEQPGGLRRRHRRGRRGHGPPSARSPTRTCEP